MTRQVQIFSLSLSLSLFLFIFIFHFLKFNKVLNLLQKNKHIFFQGHNKIKILSHLYLHSLSLSLSHPERIESLFLSLGFVRVARLNYAGVVANHYSELSYIASLSKGLSNGVVSIQSR
jgi:hypothetical protein